MVLTYVFLAFILLTLVLYLSKIYKQKTRKQAQVQFEVKISPGWFKNNQKADTLITGGAGFVGSVLLKQLQEKYPEKKIVVFDISKQIDANVSKNVAFARGDLSKQDQIQQLFKTFQPTEVYHVASLIPTVDLPKKILESINIDGSDHIIQACLQYNTERLLYTSSIGAIFDKNDLNSNMNMTEDKPYPKEPIDDYSYTKQQVEMKVLEAGRNSNGKLSVSIIRPSAIIGFSQENMIYRLLEGKNSYFGVGTSILDWVPVEYVAEGHILVMKNLLGDKKANMEIYNCGGYHCQYRKFNGCEEDSKNPGSKKNWWGHNLAMKIPKSILLLLVFINENFTRLFGIVLIHKIFKYHSSILYIT